MPGKKAFLALLALSSVSLFLHHRGHFSWTMKVFHLDSLPTHPSPTQKPKHTSVAFLKTHKTASSTMQNLMFRFAERHNLTVALPYQMCGHQFCYPSSFNARFVHPHTLPPHIITSHMRFNLSELRRLMPNDTVYVTVLREPASMFESLFSYYNQDCQSFKRVPNGSLEAFLAHPTRYYRPEEKDSVYAHNTLTFDLGGDRDRPSSDVEYARHFIEEIEREFSLVMISEYFDESLVLLRHLLAWDLEDMLYVKLNMRASRTKLSSGLPAQVRAWNALDARLYDHFNASLWRQLATLGPGHVAREVGLLQAARERAVLGCFGGQFPRVRSGTLIKNKELRPWQPNSKVDIVGYELPLNASRPTAGAGGMSQDVCLKLIMPEVQYTRVLLRSQSLLYRKKYALRFTPPVRSPGPHLLSPPPSSRNSSSSPHSPPAPAVTLSPAVKDKPRPSPMQPS
ncbi:galactose-3-O-sulfotransferase 3-like [Conger conger]|uniref:galactose-3-O-sulfotransferase 3-like n=1 Tax=Conger conger TaxID=82655 RepID=UPI002A5A400E|nr:galactose-3-O-sulfotransferase 3-like [Conger conger]